MTFVGGCTIRHSVVEVNRTQIAVRWVNGYSAIRIQSYGADFVATEVFNHNWRTHGHWCAVDFGNRQFVSVNVCIIGQNI